MFQYYALSSCALTFALLKGLGQSLRVLGREAGHRGVRTEVRSAIIIMMIITIILIIIIIIIITVMIIIMITTIITIVMLLLLLLV